MLESCLMNLGELFRNPSSAFRGKPFWAWNGKLEEGELRRQIGVLQEMGLGGGFMHSRVGLSTPYLSEEWFRLVAACADECGKRGMEAWLYDEDRWPSGAAGGLVTRDRRYSLRFLECAVVEPAEYRPGEDELAAFTASVDGASARAVRRLIQGEKAQKGEKILVFRVVVSGPSPWYNGETYLDTLSSEAVRRFIETTHDAYGRANGREFGGVIPGIFTDEPGFGGGGDKRLPWTDSLPEVFRSRYGYDITERLPELFYVLGGSIFSGARRDYRDCVTHLFVRSFSEQIGRWCQENNLLFTGHVLSEETLLSQTLVVGSAMRFYEFMQAPGIDVLRGQGLERKGGTKPEYLTAKQCASVLRQFGRKWMLSELYGCTGWQFTFEEYKAVGDWQAALGVNLRCPHLSWYTMAGEAKRDYPAAIFFQSPWWRDYRMVEDYFSRIGVALTQGEAVRDVAVIHPIESAWGVHLGADRKAGRELDKRLDLLQQALLEEHFDFDYVDEEMLSRHGSVANGEFRMARAAYRAVVVPPMITMRKSTFALLEGFVRQGGRVLFVDPVATRVDGESSGDPKKLAEEAGRTSLDRRKIGSVLRGIDGIRRVSIARGDGTEFPASLYMLRHDSGNGRWIVFVCNTGQRKESGPLKISVPAAGQAQEWDPVTGRVRLANACAEAGRTVIRTDLPEAGSRLFVIDPAADNGLQADPPLRTVKRSWVRGWSFEYKLSESNAMPLDMPEYSVEGRAYMPAREILQADRAVRDALGLPHRGGAMVQPWVEALAPAGKGAPVSLRYRFKVEEVPSSDLRLAMENPEACQAEINGTRLETGGNYEWWIDPSLKLVPVAAGCVRKGWNEILLATNYGPKSGFECMFLTGKFGVYGSGRKFVISSLPRTLRRGDWRKQGLPFYSGAVTYEMSFKAEPEAGSRILVSFPGWKGTLLKIRVNGRSAGSVAWKPWEVDVSDAVQSGINKLEVEVVSSRRNLLGPLHLSEVYPAWTGPWEFVDRARYTDRYVGVPYGLTKPPIVTVKRPAWK